MKVKSKNNKFSISLIILIIGLLLSTSFLKTLNTQALPEENYKKHTTDSFDQSDWKWTITEVVSTESEHFSTSPSLATDEAGNVHIAWEDYTDNVRTGTDYDIFYKRWNASISSWTSTEVVSTESTSQSINPSLAVDAAGNVHITWSDYTAYAGSGTDTDIFYKHWNASTSSWTTTEVVSTESTDGSHHTSIAVDAVGNVHITWEDGTDYAGAGSDKDIFYKRWDASISSWTTTEVVSTESTDYSFFPSLATDSVGNVHITWEDGTDYAGAGIYSDIFYKHWNASSSSWTTTEVVSTESTNYSVRPSLAVDSLGNVHITWYDGTDYAGAGTDPDIFYKRWNDSISSWTTTEVISTESTFDSYEPSLGEDSAGNVYIAWEDRTAYAGAGGDRDIFYKFWNASISTWNTTEVVSIGSILDSAYPSLAVDSVGNVHVAWHDYTDYAGAGVDRDIFYKFWKASSSSWTTTEVVSTESTDDSNRPSLATDAAGNVYIAWHDETDYTGAGLDSDIFYNFWNASISSWDTTEVVSTESTHISWVPSLTVDTLGNVHVVWYDETDYAGAGSDTDIFYKRWDSSISSWTTTEVVSTESTDNSYSPSLAVDSSGNVHVAWNDRTAYGGSGTDIDIFYKHWNSSTSSWTTTEVVSSESTGHSSAPSLAVDDKGNIHVAWDDRTAYAGAGGDYDIFYKFWNASTSSWIVTEVISTESTDTSFEPSLAVDSSGNVHVVWLDYTDYAGAGGTDWDIFYKHWDNSTSSWTTTEVVSTESTDYSLYPSLAVDDKGNVHVAWHDETDYAGAGLDSDIFYKYWDASTSSWNATEVVSTESTDDSVRPSLAIDSIGYIHVAWEDYTDYASSGIDSDIFLKHFAGPPTAPILSPILPNPTYIATLSLNWNDLPGASLYYIFRSTSNILSVEGLTPIGDSVTHFYIDTLPTVGTFYYVIVASNFIGNSTLSNCWSIVYVPVIYEFSTISGLMLATVTFLIVIMRTRKNKLK